MEPRFLAPQGWQWGQFTNKNGVHIRYGFAEAANPEAVVIILPGRAEYGEKYFETAQDLLNQNFSVYVIDWAGQGLSRYQTKFPKRGYASDFGDSIQDLHQLVTAIKTEKPLVMLAHSMGANLGLRYLAAHPDIFCCAGFISPMIGIRALSALSFSITLPLLKLLNKFMADGYTPGEKDWRDGARGTTGSLSSDLHRATIHNRWMVQNPELQVGGVTWDWLYKAMQSCAVLQKPETAKSIKIPCLITLAGRETLVDNEAARRFALSLPLGLLKEIPGAGHEILMERDEVRHEFFAYFYTLVHQNIV